MTDASDVEEWRSRLERVFEDSLVEVTDESHRHAGHLPSGSPSRGTHASVRVVSAGFEGVPLPQRHRMVYQALGFGREENALHAVQVRALTPDEAAREARR
ncbi:MAG: BolA family transcriptional regulator [Candidatus Omnitrophica bacterium]|jgi:BolA protein|nr:BolA family transcriptional regulator [Candidatus Omnitrophota bacterium]